MDPSKESKRVGFFIDVGAEDVTDQNRDTNRHKSFNQEVENGPEAWDTYQVDPDQTEINRIPSPWPHRFRIFVHRVFSLVFLVLSLGASTFQCVSLSVVCYLLHPGRISENFECRSFKQAFPLSETFKDTHKNQTSSENQTLTTNEKILLSRLSSSVFLAMLVPDIYCLLYSTYFLIFKKVSMPTRKQLFAVFAYETVYAMARCGLVFYIGPYLTKSINISLSWFITFGPILLNFMSSDKSTMQLPRLCPDFFTKTVNSIKKHLTSFLWVSGVAIFCFAFFFSESSFRLTNQPSEELGIVFGAIAIVVGLSVVNVANFSTTSTNSNIQKFAKTVLGTVDSEEYTSEGQLNDLSLLGCYCIVSLWRLSVTVVLYVLYCYVVHDFELYYHSSCKDSQLQSSWFDLAKNPTTGIYSDAGLMDFWIWLFVVSSSFTSYIGKLSVRVDLQSVGFAIPGILGPCLAVVTTFGLDSYVYKKQQNSTLETFDTWVYNDNTNPLSTQNWIFLLVINITGILSFILLTTYIWKNKAWTYPLERDIFVLPGFRIINTATFNLLNRRVKDIPEELEEKLAEEVKYLEGERKTRQTMTNGRRTTMFKRGATSIWEKGQDRPYIFICTTLWHEEEIEMKTLMRSVSKLLRHAESKSQMGDNDGQSMSYELEMHIFFDNVFESKKRESKKKSAFINSDEWLELNHWVHQFLRVMKEVLAAYGDNAEDAMNQGRVVRTPYGGRLEYTVAGYPFIIHLKNADLVQRGKRWSQVMYLYYLIGWKIDACRLKTATGKRVTKDKSFILALDGDVDFEPAAFELLLDRCLRNDKVAACCGQIHPSGSGYLVAYQNFEYAVGHWFQKTAEHVLGCVLCSPGCFSLMRVSYLSESNVIAMYKSLPETAMQKLQYDQGEDRWLCTLMLMAGGRIEFEGSSHCNTFAPEELKEFYKQRRRWGPSTTANIWELIKNQKLARKNNSYISGPYILYQWTVLIFSLIGLSTTIMMITEAFHFGLGATLPRWASYLIVLTPVFLYTVACYMSNDGEFQLNLATWFSLGFSFIMACVLIGVIIEGINCPLSPSFLFFAALAAINIIGALLHGDIYAIFCGIIYFLFIPSCFIFLMIYSVANLNDVSWGTRQGKTESKNVSKKTFWQKLTGKTDKQIEDEQRDGSSGCTNCVLCLDPGYEVRIQDDKKNSKQKPEAVVMEPQSGNQVEIKPQSGNVAFRHSTKSSYNMAAVDLAVMEKKGFIKQTIPDKEIHKESLYGGYTISQLRTFQQDDLPKYMIQESDVSQNMPKKVENHSITLRDIHNRELQNYIKSNGASYLSWAISDGAPINKNCKVYSLSNPEQAFWDKMVDNTDGYIGIKNKGDNREEIKEIENKVNEDLNKFRDEKFMYYIFINVLWMIISLILLMYSDQLWSFPIRVPDGFPAFDQCGVNVTIDQPNFDNYLGDDYEPPNDQESSYRALMVQPFSVFFLIIYIIIILIQFFCMLWHRKVKLSLSTLWHFIAYINVPEEKRQVVKKREERKKMIEKAREVKNEKLQKKRQEDYDESDADDQVPSELNSRPSSQHRQSSEFLDFSDGSQHRLISASTVEPSFHSSHRQTGREFRPVQKGQRTTGQLSHATTETIHENRVQVEVHTLPNPIPDQDQPISSPFKTENLARTSGVVNNAFEDEVEELPRNIKEEVRRSFEEEKKKVRKKQKSIQRRRISISSSDESSVRPQTHPPSASDFDWLNSTQSSFQSNQVENSQFTIEGAVSSDECA